MPFARKLGNQYTIKEIFSKYWDCFYSRYEYKNIRSSIIANVRRMIACRDLSKGYVMFLHSFGRDLKLNPHIHVLIAERVVDNNLNFKRFDFFNFESLRKSFMNRLLNRIYHFLKDNVSKDVII